MHAGQGVVTQGSLHHDAHAAIRRDSHLNHVMRQLVGSSIHFCIAQLLALIHQTPGIGRLCSPSLKDLSHCPISMLRGQLLLGGIEALQHLHSRSMPVLLTVPAKTTL